MGKTNYTKVEEALAEGMRKIEVDRLLQEADKNSGAKAKEPSSEKPQVGTVLIQRLKKIDHDLKNLEKRGKKPYESLKINPEEIRNFLKNPAAMTKENWEKVKTIKEQIATFTAELEKKNPEEANDGIVTKEVKKQKTKRFNINEDWIPLR